MAETAPSIRLTSIPPSLLQFPPASIPAALPAPSGDPTLAHPFDIPPAIYNAVLDVNLPITVAIVYATTVLILNRYNHSRQYKPWAISKTKTFLGLVLLHNVFLAVYSALTCAGMINAVRISWPGWDGESGLVGAIDSLCKINGPRGLGDAATFDSAAGIWGFTNKAFHLGADDLPDSTDVGRIWNEGLAFWGWLFYLSKFYEVFDTLIVLAKGKKSSLLQTYHHAGAMICMWAGIRYMAPPIWMFVLVNSGIHALMYTYFTFTALSFKVPMAVKRFITTLQIVQFIVGASFAFAHLFIEYSIPVSIPYSFSIPEIASAVSSDVASAVSVATATASADLGSWLKKLAFRAAGREGLAENVVNEKGQTFGIDAVHAVQDLKMREEIRYRDEFKMIHCTDTSGEAFAILLNCMYLAPLTWLFVRFFIRSYMKRAERRRSSTVKLIEQSSKDALKGLARQVKEAAMENQDTEVAVEEEKPAKTAPEPKAEPEADKTKMEESVVMVEKQEPEEPPLVEDYPAAEEVAVEEEIEKDPVADVVVKEEAEVEEPDTSQVEVTPQSVTSSPENFDTIA